MSVRRIRVAALVLFAWGSIGARDCLNSPWMVGDPAPPLVTDTCGPLEGYGGWGVPVL
jgi:hypothetical protein